MRPNNLLYLFTGFRIYSWFSIDDPRHGSFRDSSKLCDFLDSQLLRHNNIILRLETGFNNEWESSL